MAKSVMDGYPRRWNYEPVSSSIRNERLIPFSFAGSVAGTARKLLLLLVFVAFFLLILLFTSVHPNAVKLREPLDFDRLTYTSSRTFRKNGYPLQQNSQVVEKKVFVDSSLPEEGSTQVLPSEIVEPDSNPVSSLPPLINQVNPSFMDGRAIASKLGNETAKAELGRAAWKLFHTVFARFPDNPTPDESESLRMYIHLFQKLYPCGECANHFGLILKQYPPQVSSRSNAAAWGCFVHNLVNERLGKEIFDCNKIGDFYKCGCADADDKNTTTTPSLNT